MAEPRRPRPRVPTHRVYIDESGDHTYANLDDVWRKYLALLGVWFKQGPEYEQFSDSITRLKRDIFQISPDERLILHRSEIKWREGRFVVLKDKATDKRFCEMLLRIVEETPFTMVCVIIDKGRHKGQYAFPIHPYHFSMTALIERYGFWLTENGGIGDAMIESRGRTEDRELEAVYSKVATAGTKYLSVSVASRVFTSKELKVRHKQDDIAGLQLADLLVTPVKTQALRERDLCPEERGFSRELAAAARSKYRGYFKGSVTGRGLVML